MASIVKGRGAVRLARSYILTSPWAATLLGSSGGGGGGGNAANAAAPMISGARGGSLTAIPGVWTGATSVSGQWYADGVATGNTTTSFTDSDTSKSLEYRETALPGSVVAKGFRGAYVDPPQAFADNFDDNSKNTALWGTDGFFQGSGTTAGTVVETNQRVEITPPANVSGNNGTGYISNWTFDFTGAGVSAQFGIVTALSGVTQTWFGFGPDANNNYAVAYSSGTLYLIKTKAGLGSIAATGPAWNAVNHKFQQVRWGGPSDDRVYLDASPDGTTWTNLTSAARDAAIVLTNAKIAFGSFTYGSTGSPGTCYFDNLTTDAAAITGPASNVISSAVINVQPSTAPGNKQIDFSATIGMPGSTGAQYKIETEAGEFVQGWTAATFSSPTASGTGLLPRFGYEGQKLNVLVRNVGGTVNTASRLTATNGYVMSTPMWVGLNDGVWADYAPEIPGRDWFEGFFISNTGIIAQNYTSADRQAFKATGLTQDNYNHWAEAYSASQVYPHAPAGNSNSQAITSITFVGTTATVTTTSAHYLATGAYVTISGAAPSPYNVTDVAVTVTGATTFTYTMASTPASNATTPGVFNTIEYQHCHYQGLDWQTTDNTPKLRAAPSTAATSGAGADWKLSALDVADGELVGLTGDRVPTKFPDDPNLTLFFEYPWYPPNSRLPITINCKTQPGIKFALGFASLGTVSLTQSPSDLAAGQFTLTYSATAPSGYNGMLVIDRAGSTAALNSTFFLSGVPTYETGAPAADIGGPYISLDKSSDMDPFAGVRYMSTSETIERFAGRWNGTFTAANNTAGGTTRLWKYMVDTANRLGHKYVHVNEPDGADDTYRTAMATYFRDHLNPGILIMLERSNEQWNYQYQNAVDLLTRAQALAPADGAYNKPYLLHSREHNAMVAVWKSVFGAAYASRVQPLLAWQSSTSVSTWQQMLDFENTWQNVGRLSIAPYVDSGIGNWTASPNVSWEQDQVIAAVGASDQAAFNTHMNNYMAHATDYEVGLAKALFDFLPGYSISKGLNKNAIQLIYYEAGWFIVNSTAGWDSAFGAGAGDRAKTYFDAWKYSSGGGEFYARYIDQLALNAPGAMNVFSYTAGANSWGIMSAMGHTTQEPMATVRAKAQTYNV